MPALIISDECYYGEHDDCEGVDNFGEELCECSCHDKGDGIKSWEEGGRDVGGPRE